MISFRYCTAARRFMAAYRHDLNGQQAAWAVKKYKGHRTVPENILSQYEQAHPVASTPLFST
jgi:hypothetical protein